VLVCGTLALPALADSQARIVRLSDVEGTLQIDRNTGQGYENAFLNMPITQGTKLKTKDDGRAEIEFEDGSTVRITPNTTIEFPQLSLQDSGGYVSTVVVQEGTAYVNYSGKKDDQFMVSFGREAVSLTQSAHFRVQLNDSDATLAVFKGAVQAAGPSGNVDVGKKQAVTFDLADNDKYTLAKNLEEDPFDAWDKQQEQYHQQYSANRSYSSPYAYGASDLSYYGNFMNVSGYGMMWQPYFVGMGWDPFMNGAWMWYPGFGYTWVSAYPWGWMPYRYGNWVFVPGMGWLWQPGNSWAGWNTLPRVMHPPQRFTMIQPPSSPGHNIVVVNRGPVASPAHASPRTMVIRNGSAGMGIPRGVVRNLGQVSRQLERNGASTATIDTTPAIRPAPGTPSTSAPRTVAPHTVAPATRMGTPPVRTAPHSTPRSTSRPH
jgi:hypothetical protein